MINISLTADDPKELGFAIGKAQKKAKEIGGMIWVYSTGVLLWMTDSCPSKNIVAQCWPGGRVVLWRSPK